MPSADHREVSFDQLTTEPLYVDAIYKGGTAGGRGDDPISKLLGVGNVGGFRLKGSIVNRSVRYGALFTSTTDPDWPDVLDTSSGLFTYHGDQKTPGRDIHDTSRKGNLFLSRIFEALGQGREGRLTVPPLFLFRSGRSGADVIFQGLLAPGGSQVPTGEQLVAIWRTKGAGRYLNYRAIFSVLDVQCVSRAWIEDVQSGNWLSTNCPEPWRLWVETGVYRTLRAERPLEWRTKEEQLPSSRADAQMIDVIYEYFRDHPTGFEACAAQIWTMMAPNADVTEVTRAVIDHGRDAVGAYRLGPAEDPIKLSFSLEAKLYARTNGVHVEDLARLISRLRYREFGVLVTTSYVGRQAYQELREDRHPVVVICGADIVRVLRARGFTGASDLSTWLESEFPL